MYMGANGNNASNHNVWSHGTNKVPTLLVQDWPLDPARGFSMRPCKGLLLLLGTSMAPSGRRRTCKQEKPQSERGCSDH